MWYTEEFIVLKMFTRYRLQMLLLKLVVVTARFLIN